METGLLPTSGSPPAIDGIHVGGGPRAEQTGLTTPTSLEATLKAEYDNQVHPEQISLLSKDNPENLFVDEIHELIDRRFDVLLAELGSGDYEYVHLTVFYLNMLQHFYWDDAGVEDAWRQIDDRVGDLLAAPELDRLLVMSDHGSNEIRTEFHINTWLEREGYLVTADSTTDWLSRLGITRERVRPLLGKLTIEWRFRRFVPDSVQHKLPAADGRIRKSGKETLVDWDRSTAVASGQGPLYVLAAEPSERERIRDELVAALDGLTDGAGNAVIREALPASTVYDGPHVADGPDVVLRQALNIHIDGSFGADDLFGEPETWRGENKEMGLYMAYGYGFSTEGVPDDMHILDIAPTMLHLHGEAVPSALDGTVRTELFAPDSDYSCSHCLIFARC